MSTKTFPPALWSSLSFGLEGGVVGIFSRTKDQPTARLMHSLCAACSWRQSFGSGTAPSYYICFPRVHTLIVGLLSITEPELSPFSFSFKTWSFGFFLCAYSVQEMVSTGTFFVPWHSAQHKTSWWKNERSLLLVALSPSTVSLFCEQSWLSYNTLTDKLENNTINSWCDLKLAILLSLFPLQSRFSSPPPVPCSIGLAWLGTYSLWKCGMNYPLLKEMDVIEWFVAVY